MADKDKIDYVNDDLDVIVREVRLRNGGSIDARKALEILVNKLKHSSGYYTWASLGDDTDAVWQLRIPREDLADEPWLKEENAEALHICRPHKFLEAVEARDKDGSSDHVGYVRDADGKLNEQSSMRCTKCRREMPLDVAKKATVQIKLHRLGRKR